MGLEDLGLILTHTHTHQKRIQAIMTLCFESVRHKLTHKLGFFDLLGFDFMVDTDFNVSQQNWMCTLEVYMISNTTLLLGLPRLLL